MFVYHQSVHPDFGPDCRDFLDRVERGDIQALTTDVVINEVNYIIQIQRAANLLDTFNRSIIHARIAADAMVASKCWLAVEQFLNLLSALQRGGLTVIDVELRHYYDTCAVGRQFQLFVSDATHIVICQHLGIEHVASNDVDLGRVPFLTRWEPRF
jgi:predicted nucleic acid-binding protein